MLTLTQGILAAEVPSAGSALQEIPSAPAPEKIAPQFNIELESGPASSPGNAARFKVNSLNITGIEAFPAAELISVTGFSPGSELDLNELRGFAVSIANHYRSQGYFLAQAYLPAQEIVDGAVTITVAEGRYGEVILRNETNLSDVVARQLLSGLNEGDTITIAPLESRLLQLAALPGVNVKSSLVPGASTGASDLIVDVLPGQRISGSLDADNHGSRYTGEYRTGATLNLNNALGRGDVATLRVLTSWDGLNYGRAAFQMQAGRADLGVAYTALKYNLGREFEGLQAHGTARIAGLYGRYPLIRSRTGNLYAQLGVDAKQFRDELDVTTPVTVTDKETRVGMLSLLGDVRDGFGGGGFTSYSFTWTTGNLDLESAEASRADALSARSNGRYDKAAIRLSRLQQVAGSLSLYGAVQGQLSSRNLDVSEKTGLGGADAVRAYPEGESYVDEGYVVNLEVRLALPKLFFGLPGTWQAVSFLDSGTGNASKDPWSEGRNRRTLSGGGVGLNWFDARGFRVSAYYAHTIGAAEATSAPDKDSRFWISGIKYF